MPNTLTPTQQLAEVLIGQPLPEYIRAKRNARPSFTWRLIAEDIERDTNGKVKVTPYAVSMWAAAFDAAEDDAAAHEAAAS